MSLALARMGMMASHPGVKIAAGVASGTAAAIAVKTAARSTYAEDFPNPHPEPPSANANFNLVMTGFVGAIGTGILAMSPTARPFAPFAGGAVGGAMLGWGLGAAMVEKSIAERG